MAGKTFLKTTLTISVFFVVLAFAGTAQAKIIYVDDDAIGANDGSTWHNAYQYLQDALAAVKSGGEIKVAQGNYRPDQGAGITPGDRTATFQLINGVTLKGGYAGISEPDPDSRDIKYNNTILSGDIGIAGDNSDNSYHVVTSSGVDETAVIDRLTITAGQADGSFPHDLGGGIHNFGGSPTVNYCRINWNYASGGGGGVSSDGEPTFTLCGFNWNETGGSGGGLYVWSGSATLNGCTFYKNSAGWGGGGLAIQTAATTVTNCDFRINSAGINGGGMCCDGGTYTLTGCIFWGNSAERGGALWNIDCTAGLRDNPVVSDCRFYNNEATNGGGMFNSFSTPTVAGCTFGRNSALSFGGGVYNEDGSAAVFEGCVFYDNRAEVRGGGMSNHGSSPELTKCTFKSNYAGDGGGGMNNTGTSGPKLFNCLFEENTILDGGGGGMYNYGSPTLTDCTFIGNSAPYESGGGINNYGTLALVNCMFVANSGDRGGGIHNLDGSATLTNCLFIANSANDWAGGLCSNSSTIILTNCTFAANSSPNGNALGFRSAQNRPSSNVEVANCILWDGGDEIWNEDSSVIAVSYSDVQGGWTGEGNIDADPCFASLGYWGGDGVWIDGDYHLLPDSACINAGDPGYAAGPNETDLDDNPRVSGGRIDMGIYELQPLRVVYVDADSTGNNDGSSWADAYNYLQDALTAAYFGDKIWVAQGVYRPDEGGGNTSGDREATFQLINGVILKGGYAGFGETDPNARNIELYETILSGDLAGDDGPDFANNSENSWHVVRGNGTTTAILDGFTVTGGNANGSSSYYYSGGGVYNQSGRATIVNCTFSGNWARDFGGGMYNNQSTPTLTNCTFTCNWATYGGGMYNNNSGAVLTNCAFSENIALAYESGYGGGMYNSNSNCVLTNCIFTRNMADTLIPDHGGGLGGGMFNDRSSKPTLTNCTFTGNTALCGGGGIGNRSSSPTLNNCIFTGNLAIGKEGRWGNGGAIFNASSTPLINGCTFSGNSASRSGGGMFNGSSHPILTNCIFWGDIPEEINLGYRSTTLITYSDVQGGWLGTGNINADPCFVSPGYWGHEDDPNIIVEPNDPYAMWFDGDYHLLSDSPCINAGDPDYVAEPNEADLDGRPRVIGRRVDMGAYEYSGPLPAELRIIPRTINLASESNWITALLWLGKNYNVGDIDPNSVFLEEIKAGSLQVDEQEQVAIARFTREQVQNILETGDIELTITGRLTDGTVFEGTDVIRVLNKAGKK